MIKTNTTGQVGIGALALGLVLAALMIAASLTLAATKPAHAATTFTVTSTSDSGNGVCDSVCTLREAISAANNTPGKDAINFRLSNTGGVRTIVPTSELPEITEAVTIDGYSQLGSSPNTLTKGTNAVLRVELDGSNAGRFEDGLDIRASNVVVRGLVINRFDNAGIRLGSPSNDVSDVRIEGNFIGTDATGAHDRGNARFGVLIGGFVNNVLATGDSNSVGGTSPSQRNLISGNDLIGIEIGSTEKNKVAGNLIGTAKDGVSPLGNVVQGVEVSGSSGNFVGDFSPSAANTIAFNGGVGVQIREDNSSDGSTSNRILSNSIFSNGRLGINLVGGTENETGATKNDPGDTDTGPNDVQNKPKIKSATTSAGKTTIKGKLNSTSRDPFVIQFFSNPPGTDEGKKFLGDESVSTDPDGSVTFTFELNQKVDAGANITATATNVVDGNTSEFSGPRAVVAQ